MAYLFHEKELPSLISEVPGRERIFFVNQELANIDDMLAGVMHYKKGAASPLSPAQELRALLFHHRPAKPQVETTGGHPSGRAQRYDLHPGQGQAPAARRSSRCSISNGRLPTASRPPSWKAPMPICVGTRKVGKSLGCRPETVRRSNHVIDLHRHQQASAQVDARPGRDDRGAQRGAVRCKGTWSTQPPLASTPATSSMPQAPTPGTSSST